MNPSNSVIPHQAIHPGLHLREELTVRGIKQNELAAETSILPSQLNEILKGKRPITPDFAILLGAALNQQPERWNTLQANYDLDVARIQQGVQEKIETIRTWQAIKEVIPVSYFRKQNELSGNLKADISHLVHLLDFSSVQQLITQLSGNRPAGIHFKKSSKLSEHASYINTWIRYVKHISVAQKATAFTFASKDELLTDLKKLFQGKDVLTKLPIVLEQYGIKLVIRGKPDHAPLDGAAFWHEDNPVMGLTLRHLRYDNLIFTVYHELGHIFLHLGQDKATSFVDSLEDGKDNSNEQEAEANDFARNTLVSADRWREFTLGRSEFSDAIIQRFADNVGVPAPTIWGRLCFEGRIKYACASVHQKKNQIP